MALKIKIVEIDGEQRVPPKVMELLTAYKDHEKICPDCESAFKNKIATSCPIGAAFMEELNRQPEVEFVPD